MAAAKPLYRGTTVRVRDQSGRAPSGCGGQLAQRQADRAARRRFRGLVGALVFSFIHPQRHLQNQINERRDIAVAEASNLRGYLATGTQRFSPGPRAQIPYSIPVACARCSTRPKSAAALPPELTGNRRRILGSSGLRRRCCGSDRDVRPRRRLRSPMDGARSDAGPQSLGRLHLIFLTTA